MNLNRTSSGAVPKGMNTPPIRSAAATALVLAVVAAPAFATGAVSATVAYTCPAPFGAAHPALRYVVDQPPGTVVAGQTVRLGTTATFALDAATTHKAQVALGWVALDGTVRTTPTGSRAGLRLSIATTPLANGSTGATNAPVSGTTILRATKAGTDTLRLRDLGDLVLHGFDADGHPVSSIELPAAGGLGSCANDSGATTLIGATGASVVVKVLRDTTTTTATAAYSPARAQATGTVKVSSRFGLAPTGKAAFTLRKGTHTIATHRVRLGDRGVARARFSNLTRAGRYSIVGTYLGSTALLSSRDKARFAVRR